MAGQGGGHRRKPPASKAKPKPGGAPVQSARAGAGGAGTGPAAAATGSPNPPGAKQTKAQRVEAARQARRRKEALRRKAIVAGVAVVVVALVAFLVNDRIADRRAAQRLDTILTAGDCEVDERTDTGGEANHIPNPTYEVNPLAGGAHTADAASEGVYDPGEAPADGPLVHAMEHGFIVIWYQPQIPAAELERLEDIAEDDRYSNATLLVPRASLPVPVAATAWHERLLCNGVEEKPITEFIKAFRDKGPEKGFIS